MLLYARTSSVFRRCILTSRKGCIPFRKGDNMNTINATRTSATKFNTKYMVELALMVAVILVMSLTPLGYIRTPGLSITLLTVPVAVHRQSTLINRTTIDTTNSQIQQKILRFRKRIRPLADTSVYSIL